MKTKWEKKKLGDVMVQSKNQKNHINLPYVGMEDIESGTGIFLGSFDPKIVKSNTFYFNSEHVLYGRLRPYLNKVLLPDFEGHCSTEIIPLKIIGNANKKFIFYWLTSDPIVDKINRSTTGARMPRADVSELLSFEVPIPPEPEQVRIVKILDEVFEGIAKAKESVEKNIQNSKELFESYARIAFTNTGLWKEKKLGEVCELFQGVAINAKTKHILVEMSELPLLRIKDLKNNTVEQYVDPNNYPKNALVNELDLIYTRTGQIGLVFTGKRGVLHNNSFKVAPSEILDRSYLYWWLQNPEFKAEIVKLASRAAQPDITHVLFKQQKIFIPPISEQQVIVAKLDALQEQTKKLEANYKQKLTLLKELKKSILNKAFSGEL